MRALYAIGLATIQEMTDSLGNAFPRLAERLPKTSIANLPTPVREHSLSIASRPVRISVKYDDLTSEKYGGNKIRKLEYLFHRAATRNAKRVATFGTVASNHALATAIFATELDFECTCFLSHQAKTPKAPVALNMHLRNHTDIVRFGGARANRVSTLRQHLRNRRTWVIPMGGSNWLGTMGFVNAGLELAEQVQSGLLAIPDRLYVANGTMATAAGLALGLALAEMPTDVHAIRVTHESIANRDAMQRLMAKSATLMNRLDPSIPADLADRTRICFRDDFFAGGYARSNSATDRAIEFARDDLHLTLDTTYSGKAMAALLHDLKDPKLAEQSHLFWNTYNSQPLPVSADRPAKTSNLPKEFLRYYD